jgi:hypothetical protein
MIGGDHCLVLIELSTLLDSLSFVGTSLDHLMERYPVSLSTRKLASHTAPKCQEAVSRMMCGKHSLRHMEA